MKNYPYIIVALTLLALSLSGCVSLSIGGGCCP